MTSETRTSDTSTGDQAHCRICTGLTAHEAGQQVAASAGLGRIPLQLPYLGSEMEDEVVLVARDELALHLIDCPVPDSVSPAVGDSNGSLLVQHNVLAVVDDGNHVRAEWHGQLTHCCV